MPTKDDLPRTLKRSPSKAQRTWIKAHDAAVETYGEGARAHRVAMAAVKHSFEKVGDHWEPKKRRGPSDTRASRGSGPSEEGVDANASAAHLREVASKLSIPGRSRMTKAQLIDAIQRENRKRSKRS